MAREPDNLVLTILREIQATQGAHGRDLETIKSDLRRQGVKIDELFESSTMALGLAGHANIRHDSLERRLDDLVRRLEQLEKNR
jgi:hypothetical protein